MAARRRMDVVQKQMVRGPAVLCGLLLELCIVVFLLDRPTQTLHVTGYLGSVENYHHRFSYTLIDYGTKGEPRYAIVPDDWTVLFGWFDGCATVKGWWHRSRGQADDRAVLARAMELRASKACGERRSS